MAVVDPAWILSMLVALEPSSPHRETFDRSAAAIARASNASPLPGQDEEKTAAILVAVAWYESRFQPDAAGDCAEKTPAGTCAPGSTPRSFCMMQIHESNLRGLGVTRDALMTDIDACVATGLRMLRTSFQVCAREPLPGRLRHYAGGGNGCPSNADARRKSSHRVALAVELRARFPSRMRQERVSGAGVPESDPKSKSAR